MPLSQAFKVTVKWAAKMTEHTGMGAQTRYVEGTAKPLPFGKLTVESKPFEVVYPDNTAMRKKKLAAAEMEAAIDANAVDVTLPGRAQQMGTRHLINAITNEVSEIFLERLGIGLQIRIMQVRLLSVSP